MSPDSLEPMDPVDHRLVLWDEARDAGGSVTPEQLCVDHPEYLAPLREKISALLEFERRFQVESETEDDRDDTTRNRTTVQNGGETSPGQSLTGLEILEEIGRGGVGVVYKARQIELDRLVAVKVVHASGLHESDARERFLREAKAIARLEHPHIVQIYDVRQNGRSTYLVLQYVESGSLRDRLKGSRPTPDESATLMETLAGAIAYAHSQGVLHRDLKPGNVLLGGDTAGGIDKAQPRITDFGLAHLLDKDDRLTKDGESWGSPSYMSPEQVNGDVEQTGHPTVDVWGLGAIFYELLTGLPPFRGPNSFQTMQQVVKQAIVPPSKIDANVPKDLEAICLRCLEKDPSQRYPTAEALRADLAAWRVAFDADRRVILKPKRRSRRLAHLLTAVSLVILVGLGASVLLRRGGSPPEAIADPRPARLPAVATDTRAPIRLGSLFSMTGPTSASERAVHDAVVMAVKEINEAGGLLGRPVSISLADGRCQSSVFVDQTERLLRDEKVSAIVGCYMSADRRSVVPVVERYDGLLFYPVAFEGLESSPSVFYTGAMPNQRIVPAVRWIRSFLEANRFFFLGGDEIWSRGCAEVTRDRLKLISAELVGEVYLPPGIKDFGAVLEQIESAKPDVVIITLGGERLVSLIDAIDGKSPVEKITKLIIHPGKYAVRTLGLERLEGTYLVGNYIETLPLLANQLLLESVEERYGPGRFITDAMESAYVAVHLWANAVREAGVDDVDRVKEKLLGMTLDAPEGRVRVDPETHGLEKWARIIRVGANTKVEMTFESSEPIPPDPFPSTRTRAEWDSFLEELRTRWNGQWSATRSD